MIWWTIYCFVSAFGLLCLAVSASLKVMASSESSPEHPVAKAIAILLWPVVTAVGGVVLVVLGIACIVMVIRVYRGAKRAFRAQQKAESDNKYIAQQKRIDA